MSILLAFAGPAGAGKTTCADILTGQYGFKRVSFAGILKDMLEAGGFGRPWTLEEKEAIIPSLGVSYRHLAQTLGTEWGRVQVHPDIWVKMTMQKLRQKEGNYVIDDLRFENEATAVRAFPGHVIHLLNRAAAVGQQTASHESEKGIRRLPEDYTLDNGLSRQHLWGSLVDLLVEIQRGKTDSLPVAD